MTDIERKARFERVALPQLDAAFNLARWLTGNDRDAEDVVQEAYLRAFRYFDGYRGGDGRSWMLSIVRRTAFTWLERNRRPGTVPFEEFDASEMPAADGGSAPPDDPEQSAIRSADRRRLGELIAALPAQFRDVLVLRELEDMPYRDIATVCGIPVGTVMSRLARARAMLRQAWIRPQRKGLSHGL